MISSAKLLVADSWLLARNQEHEASSQSYEPLNEHGNKRN
jgi:hypothetical protein